MKRAFVIYRIIGNALPPRHDAEHTFRNLEIILGREPDFPGCDKRWLLNRIVDPKVFARCVAMIEARGQAYHVIPFDAGAYRATFYDASGMPGHFGPFGPEPSKGRAQYVPVKAYEWILRHKSLTLIALNAARNLAIEMGHADAPWVLPLDGWSYITTEAWQGIASGLTASSDALYGMIPLSRLENNAQLDDPESLPPAQDEPQIAFRRDAPDRFDALRRYGNMNKAELLMRLGYPGPWHRWNAAPWETTPQLEAIAPNRFVTCGAVYRLASGAAEKVELDSGSRHLARYKGVSRMVRLVDRVLLGQTLNAQDARRHAVLTPDATWPAAGPLDTLRATAEAMLARPAPSILDKDGLAPSGDPRDYISAARYRHADHGEITRDEDWVDPAALIGTPESRIGDRTALWECMQRASVLTASGVLCHRPADLEAASGLLLQWFGDPATAMHPHARYAQALPLDEREPSPAGWIDFRDLWMLSGLCRSLRRNGALSDEGYGAIARWAARLLDELEESEQGKMAYWSRNNIGTWSHLLKLALALFAERIEQASDLLDSATLRLAAQCGAGGIQESELRRARPLHYSLFNLTAWALLADLGRALGVDLWRYRGVDGQSICRMFHFLARHGSHLAALEKQDTDWRRWLHALLFLVPDHAADRGLLQPRNIVAAAPWMDDPDRGLPPQWWFYLLWQEC